MKTLVCAVLLGLFAPLARAQPIATDRLEAVMITGGAQRELPMGEERLQVSIDGQHATTTLLQVYENTSGAAISVAIFLIIALFVVIYVTFMRVTDD